MTPMSAPSAAPAPNEETITHSTAATRPRQRTSMIVTRASAISAQQRISTPPASRRSSSRSSRSRSAVSAIWKRYAESPVSTTSVARSTATESCKRLSKAFKAPVAPITAAATAGINHDRCAIAVSRRRKAVVNTSTSAAIYRSPHASEPETRYPAAAPRTHCHAERRARAEHPHAPRHKAQREMRAKRGGLDRRGTVDAQRLPFPRISQQHGLISQ